MLAAKDINKLRITMEGSRNGNISMGDELEDGSEQC